MMGKMEKDGEDGKNNGKEESERRIGWGWVQMG